MIIYRLISEHCLDDYQYLYNLNLVTIMHNVVRNQRILWSCEYSVAAIYTTRA